MNSPVAKVIWIFLSNVLSTPVGFLNMTCAPYSACHGWLNRGKEKSHTFLSQSAQMNTHTQTHRKTYSPSPPTWAG